VLQVTKELTKRKEDGERGLVIRRGRIVKIQESPTGGGTTDEINGGSTDEIDENVNAPNVNY